VAYDPGQPHNVYAATDAGLFFSTDGGENWSLLNTPGTPIEALIRHAWRNAVRSRCRRQPVPPERGGE